MSQQFPRPGWRSGLLPGRGCHIAWCVRIHSQSFGWTGALIAVGGQECVIRLAYIQL